MAERYTPDDIDSYLSRLIDADDTQIAALRRANSPKSYAISELMVSGTLDIPFSPTLLDTDKRYRARYTQHIRALLGF